MKILGQKKLSEIKAEKEGASSGYLGLIQELQKQNEQLIAENETIKEELNLTQEAVNTLLLSILGEGE